MSIERTISELNEALGIGYYVITRPLQSKGTNAYHIFKADMENGRCVKKGESLCSAREVSQVGSDETKCFDEDTIRKEAAKIGRDVCGNCVRELYADKDK